MCQALGEGLYKLLSTHFVYFPGQYVKWVQVRHLTASARLNHRFKVTDGGGDPGEDLLHPGELGIPVTPHACFQCKPNGHPGT